MQFHEKLKAAREDADLTQEEASEKIGIQRQQLSRYERGAVEPTVTRLRELCELYNVSADYLLGLRQGMPFPRA